MRFASDNTSGAAPEIMAAVLRANEGYAQSYGADAAMERVTTLVRDLFEAPDAVIHLVATGTAANALAIATHCPPWGAVFCHTRAYRRR
jgi:threonine aldolase